MVLHAGFQPQGAHPLAAPLRLERGQNDFGYAEATGLRDDVGDVKEDAGD